MDLFASKKKLFLVLTILICACNSNNDTIRDENLIELKTEAFISTYIDYDNPQEIKNMISNNENVLLYIYSSSCLACEEYKPLINNFISMNEVVMYALDVKNFPSLSRDEIFSYMVTPTICLYSNGKTVTKFNPISDEKAFSSSDGLKQYLDQYSFPSYKRNIKNEEDLVKIMNFNTSYIYFSYSECSDCSYFEYHFLNEYLKLKCQQIIYNYEMSALFNNKDLYKEFTDKYGLSYDGNNKYGYLNGVVPTFQYYENGILNDTIIVYNDQFDREYNDLNEISKITMTSSYYLDNPNIGKEYFSNSEGSAYEMYRKDTLDYFVKKFYDFLTH